MKLTFLFSSIKPLLAGIERETIDNCFKKEMKKSDQLIISVGFCSFHSLRELDRLVTKYNIKNICLILGMYFSIGFHKKLLQLVLEVNKKWQSLGIGEVRLVHSFKYHGKLYCFLKGSKIHSVILGSPNLSFLVAEEETSQKQYEIAFFADQKEALESSLIHINEMKLKDVSENIAILARQELLTIVESDFKEIKKAPKIEWKDS